MKINVQNISRLLFVPTLVLVALLAMYTRTSQVIAAVEDGTVSKLLSPASAVAQENGEAKPAETPVVETTPEEKPAPSSPEAAAGTAKPEDKAGGMRSDIATDTVLTDEDIVILQQLATRRKELDRRAAEMEQREALLQASEARITAKVDELQKMRGDVEKLLATADKQQSDQMKSLVKIYETMKPAQAAKIFEQLDMNMLLSVIGKMKEAKAAPVLAAMDPVKAKTVTSELIRRKDLQKSTAAQLDTQPNQ